MNAHHQMLITIIKKVIRHKNYVKAKKQAAVNSVFTTTYEIRPRGFEPLTPGLGNQCSIRLSYGRKILIPKKLVQVNSRLLYTRKVNIASRLRKALLLWNKAVMPAFPGGAFLYCRWVFCNKFAFRAVHCFIESAVLL